MTTSFIFRKVNGELHCFVKTVGKTYINVDFIKYLTVAKSRRKGYLVKAWLDSVHGDCFVLAENFNSEDDAKGFIHCLINQFKLVTDRDSDEDASVHWEFGNWRREIWRENHGLKPSKISLMKPLF